MFLQNFQNILLTMITSMLFVSLHVYIFISYTYMMTPSSAIWECDSLVWPFDVFMWLCNSRCVSLSWMGATLQNFINGSPLFKTFSSREYLFYPNSCRQSSIRMYLITFSFSYFNAEMYDFMIQICDYEVKVRKDLFFFFFFPFPFYWVSTPDQIRQECFFRDWICLFLACFPNSRTKHVILLGYFIYLENSELILFLLIHFPGLWYFNPHVWPLKIDRWFSAKCYFY